ncbi:hypothetical protein LCGC14_2335370, partial [marine sediment metagenome]
GLGRPSFEKVKQLNILIDNLSKKGLYDKIGVSSEGKLEFVAVNSIIRLQGESNYTRIFIDGDKSILASKSLIEFEELLGDLGFHRVHKTHIVNFSYVESYGRYKDSFLMLTNQTKIPVSRRRKVKIGEILQLTRKTNA